LPRRNLDARLIKLLLKARPFNATLVRSDVLAEREGVSRSYITRVVRLSYPARTSPKRSSTGISRAI
jgi:hypothetical protein